MKRLFLAVLFSLLLLGIAAEPADGIERPGVAALRAAGPIRVDGRLDEPDWERAPPITGFRLMDVREGEAPSESTAVRVLLDDTHVYFGMWCGHRGSGRVRASLTPRDQILDDDHISIHLDTYRDLHRAYIFGVNPFGVQLDGILDGGDPDFSWDGVWESEAIRSDDGWVAEVAIPLRTLRFPAGGDGVWGLWFRRQITGSDEVCSWPLWRQGVPGDIMLQAGDLSGLGDLRGGGGVELQPYAASARSDSRSVSSGGALGDWSGRAQTEVGLDVKYGLTTTLTANATVNPDYSQVEADALQIDVNQRFPLFFPEKRPFFLEGAEIYNTPYSLVYTRRIADPAYGGKLTGKLGRWRLGAIAVRDEGGGSTEGIGAGSSGEPSEQGFFSIARARLDVGDNSNVGFLVTDHFRESHVYATPLALGFRAPGAGRNTVVSADGRARLSKSLFAVVQLAKSYTRQDTITDGPTIATRFSDYASTIGAKWQDGVRYALVYQDYLGSDFRADAGFLERVGIRNTGYVANFIVRPENRWLRYWQPTSNGDIIRRLDGTLEERRLAGAIEWGFQKQTYMETRVAHLDERWLSTVYDRWRYILSLSNSLWRPLSVKLEATLEEGILYASTDSASFLGWQETYGLGATARPSPQLTSELTATRARFLRERGGQKVYDFWLLGAKTTYQFTRRLYARLYPQYDTDSERLDVDGLLGYVLHPGSVLYLGMNGDLDKLGDRHRPTGRTVFFKASYLFQR